MSHEVDDTAERAADTAAAAEVTGTEPAHGPPTEATLFLGIAAFTAFIGIVYGVTTAMSGGIEPAGTAALIGTAGFAGWFGIFMLLTARRVQVDVEALEEARVAGDRRASDVLYLPTQSIWPLGLAVGLSLTLAGVALGFWVLIPGVALLTQSLIGFAHQTRTRG